MVRLLLEHGADADKAKTTDGCTPLFVASQNGHADVVWLLLENSADADKATTSIGATPLYWASRNGHTDVVTLLLQHGADADKAKTTDGATPLIMASQDGHTDVVQLLLEHGADADKATTDDGTTPLYMASTKGHTDVVLPLLEHGADPNIARADNDTTPLMMAASEGDLGTVQLLVAAGADIAMKDFNQRNAAERARNKSNLPVYQQPNRQLQKETLLATAEFLESNPDQQSVLRTLVRDGIPNDANALAGAISRRAGRAPTNNPGILVLCREIQLRWAPPRHGLFQPAHRLTVLTVLLVARRKVQLRDLSWAWVNFIPIEVWFLICEMLGRQRWPIPIANSARVTSGLAIQAGTAISQTFLRRGKPPPYDDALFVAEYISCMDAIKRHIDDHKAGFLANSRGPGLGLDGVRETAKAIGDRLRARTQETPSLLVECAEWISTINGSPDRDKLVGLMRAKYAKAEKAVAFGFGGFFRDFRNLGE